MISDNDCFLIQASDLLGMIEGDLTPLQGIHSCNNTQSIIKVTISKHTPQKCFVRVFAQFLSILMYIVIRNTRRYKDLHFY